MSGTKVRNLISSIVDKRMDGPTECYCTTGSILTQPADGRTCGEMEVRLPGREVRLSSISSSSSRLLAAYLAGIIAVALQARALDNLGPCSAIGWLSF